LPVGCLPEVCRKMNVRTGGERACRFWFEKNIIRKTKYVNRKSKDNLRLFSEIIKERGHFTQFCGGFIGKIDKKEKYSCEIENTVLF